MADALVKLAEQGATTVIALALLAFILLVAYAIVFLLPRLHGQGMTVLKSIATEITNNTAEHREARHADQLIAEQRHSEVLLKLEEMRNDFLSDDDTGEHKPVNTIPHRQQPQHREAIA